VSVVVKRSSYRTYVEDEKSGRVRELLDRDDPTVRRMRRAHEDHESTVEEVTRALGSLGVDTDILLGSWSKIHAAGDLVVTVGGDGTLLAASHQIGPETPILGVNSAPDHSVGFFCAARKGTAESQLRAAISGELSRVSLQRMRVELNGELLHNRVLNEVLCCHACPAATSRYILEVRQGDGNEEHEEQKSSGLWIGPAAGSTAAQRSAGGRVLPLTSRRLQYVVREPYVKSGERLTLRVGTVDEEGQIVVRSKMRDARLFLDGHHIVHHASIGDVVSMRRSTEPLTVLGLERRGAARDGQA
jgi:NAD+ kinase